MRVTKTKGNIPPTNFFVYRNKDYAFNLQFASTFSQILEQNKTKFQQNQKIPLIKEEKDINIPENAIESFIDFCHGQSVDINNENVLELNYLAQEYEIGQLIEDTNQYIIEHDELLLKKYIFNIRKDYENNQIYEDMISQRLSEFINNEELIELPIESLYRILQNGGINIDDKFNFLLKCLNKYGRQASVLFENIDFGEDRTKYLMKLLSPEYSNILDFRFINPEFIISMFHQQDSIIRYDEERKLEINDLKIIINRQKDQIEELQQKVAQQEHEFENLKKKLKSQNIHALFLTPTKEIPNEPRAAPINIDFIPILNTKDVKIYVDSYNETRIMEIIELNENFLDQYDVLIFGNGDGTGKYTKINYLFFDLVENFNKRGGSLLYLHDFNIGEYKNKQGKPYDMFSKDLGFKKMAESPFFMYTKAKFNEQRCGELMTYPYKLNPEFDVANTHETSISTYDQKYCIIASKEKPEKHYYCENHDKRVADCSMGHNSQITLDEKKLLFNIIYHLSQL